MTIHTNRRSGVTLICVIILFVLFIVFIGTLAYAILKAVGFLHGKNPPPDDTTATMTQQAVTDETAALQATHPGETVSVTAVSSTWVTAFVPFGTSAVYSAIERSTNLIDWEVVGSVTQGETFADTNLFPQAFYRMLTLDGSQTTNAPGFMQMAK